MNEMRHIDAFKEVKLFLNTGNTSLAYSTVLRQAIQCYQLFSRHIWLSAKGSHQKSVRRSAICRFGNISMFEVYLTSFLINTSTGFH